MTRITIFSPWTVGRVESRTSIGRPLTLSRNAPSCGRWWMAMSARAMILKRLRIELETVARQCQHRFEHAADPVADRRVLRTALDVHVARADFHCPGDDVIAEIDDRRRTRNRRPALRLRPLDDGPLAAAGAPRGHRARAVSGSTARAPPGRRTVRPPTRSAAGRRQTTSHARSRDRTAGRSRM